MKRRGLRKLAYVSRKVWIAGYDVAVKSPAPQARCELIDP